MKFNISNKDKREIISIAIKILPEVEFSCNALIISFMEFVINPNLNKKELINHIQERLRRCDNIGIIECLYNNTFLKEFNFNPRWQNLDEDSDILKSHVLEDYFPEYTKNILFNYYVEYYNKVNPSYITDSLNLGKKEKVNLIDIPKSDLLELFSDEIIALDDYDKNYKTRVNLLKSLIKMYK